MQPDHLKRISTLRKQLSNSPYDAILISSVQNCRYLSGFENTDANVAYLIISMDQLYLITDYRYSQQALKECPHYNIVERDRQNINLGQQFNQTFNEIKISHVAFEKEHMSYSIFLEIQSEIKNVQLSAIAGWVEKQRMIKDETEIACIKKAAQIADKALKNLMPYLKANVTEKEVSLELEYQMQKLGSEGLAFPTIFVSGKNTSLPHGLPSNKKLETADLITLDFGAVYDGYRSDMTRNFVVGKPNKKQLSVYDTVKSAQQAALDSIVPGIKASIPYAASKQILDTSPYAKYQGEGLGHGVGLYLHEIPFLQNNCNIELQENMVITIEPGIYIPDWGGIRIEDDIRVTKTGYELLTHSPKELIEI
ncbi:M24 family metallopeptidase [Aliikangiella sp. IMCC44359]|uniref:M24 family metallopeptidase n=1 Tax=Aliikangiella sp. IMCC44359 TaxID=3459125 RepID=UPI00403B2240